MPIGPEMPSRLSYLEMSADLGYVFAFIEQFVAFGELSDHLLRGVFPSLHGAVLLAPFWSIGTLVSSGSFQRGPHRYSSPSETTQRDVITSPMMKFDIRRFLPSMGLFANEREFPFLH